MLVLIAVSTPLALGVEWLVRRIFLPPQMDELRDWLRPQLAPFAWVLVGLALAATALGLASANRVYQTRLRRFGTRGDPSRRAQSARFETLLVVTSIPQVPALLATIGFTFGAPLAPTLATLAVGTLGVLVQWLRMRRLGEG